MRWLVTGASGMLGTDLVARLREHGEDVRPVSRADLARLDAETVRAVDADVIVNCAAYTAVDAAETDEDEALRVNGGIPAMLSHAKATLVQISTDYVLRGDGSEPWPEDAPTGPLNAYGRTKLAGEQAVLAADAGYVVRTAWLYGAHGPNFVATMARLAAERATVDVVADQHGQPTWTVDLADQIIALVRSDAPHGIYHGTNAGATTWHGLAQAVFTLLGHDPARVLPVGAADFPRPAARPPYSVLGHDAWPAVGLPAMRDWREALQDAWPRLS